MGKQWGSIVSTATTTNFVIMSIVQGMSVKYQEAVQ